MVTTTAPSTEADDFVDILIVGGGVVGSALARQLKIILPSISIGLLERGKSPLEIPTAVTANDPPNPRSYALSPTSLAILGSSTLNRISDRIAYYDSMQVWEAGSPAVLTFTNKDLVDYYHTKGNASTCQAALGAVVEDGPLVRALWQELAEASPPHIKQWTESLAINVQVPHDTSRDSVYVTIQSTEDKLPKEKLASSTSTIATRLLVGADGAQSGIRQMLGLPLVGFDYGRRAFITTVRLENTPMIPIRGRAYQRFLENGPLALLPSNLPQYATIIWSTVPEHAKELQREPDLNKVVDKLNAVLQEGPQRLPPIFPSSANYPSGLAYGFEKVLETLQYGLSLGQWQSDDAIFVVPPRIVAIEGPRFSFDLTCRQVRQYVGPRVALVGDAAHTMHPLAGQGLNLGLLDVQELVEMTASAQRSGMDLATFLSDYQQHRLRHVSLTLAGVHALHQVFGTTTSASFQHAKSLGMHFVQNLPPLKRLLAAVAAGNL
jgi:ubiquinone biosynthesis monooxygenase Coq6